MSAPDAPPQAPPRHPPNLRRRVYLLALFSTLTLAVGAVFTVQSRKEAALPPSDGVGPRALSAPLFTPRRLPDAFGGLLSRARLQSDFAADLELPAGLDVCTQVRVVGTGEVIFGLNSDRPEIPASTLKLLTGGAALEVLGPDYTFTTTARSVGAASAGVLQGSLYLVGGGDPLLSTPAYAAWEESYRPASVPVPPRTDLTSLARAIKGTGISRITGGVVGDSSFFDDQRIHPAWKQSYLDEKVIAPISGLEVNRNLSGWQQGLGPTQVGFVADPAAGAADTLRQLLVAEGVTVDGGASAGAAPAGAQIVASLPSARLADIVQQLEQASDNFIAENLLKTLGREKAGQGSFESGVKVVVQALSAKGVAMNGLVMTDGSGLARSNQVPCTLLADLLARAASSPGLAEMTRRLAVSGESGTLRQRFPEASLKGRVRGKTGGLDDVSNLAGLVHAADGVGDLSFAVLVNGDDGELAGAIQRLVIDHVLRFPAVSVVPAG